MTIEKRARKSFFAARGRPDGLPMTAARTERSSATMDSAEPAATFGFKRVALNVTYLPESVVNDVTHSHKYDPSMHGVFFLQLKLDASLFGFGRRGQPFLAENTAE